MRYLLIWIYLLLGTMVTFGQASEITALILDDDQKVIGIFTETDVIRRVLAKNVDRSLSVTEVMTKNPAVLARDDSVGKAIDLMSDNSFYHVPLVAKDRKITGMLSVRTLIRFLAEFYPEEIFNLPPRPGQFSETQEGG